MNYIVIEYKPFLVVEYDPSEILDYRYIPKLQTDSKVLDILQENITDTLLVLYKPIQCIKPKITMSSKTFGKMRYKGEYVSYPAKPLKNKPAGWSRLIDLATAYNCKVYKVNTNIQLISDGVHSASRYMW